jgi:hypothetical protein
MSTSAKAEDWQCCGVAQVGAAAGPAAGIYCFEYRSLSADFRGVYLFVGAGGGAGGSMGGAVAPSPGDVINNRLPDLWTPIKCKRPFSSDELDMSYAALSTAGVGAAYGYSLCGISAGLIKVLFTSQNVSGFGISVGASAAVLMGSWIRIGSSGYY